MTFLYELFGRLMYYLYEACGNYGLAIVLFAVAVKVIMLPLTIKQYRSTQLMQLLQPAQDVIQKKYAKNQTKMNEELQKLYQKYNYSPLSGCLPLLIQFPLIFGLWGALREPAKYVFGSEEVFASVPKNFLWIKQMTLSPVDLFKAQGLSGEFLLSLIFPILSIALTFIQQAETNKKQSSTQNDQMKMMSTMMTVFIAYISFTFNQGIAIYWTMQTGLGLVQNWVMEKFFPLNIEPPKIVKKSEKA
ncbi:MAG: membrane protein insertase YidC [Eubacteriaceae bacterium]|nr:membrane protein insertase YidC [Eubacteriaceae bacterium]